VDGFGGALLSFLCADLFWDCHMRTRLFGSNVGARRNMQPRCLVVCATSRPLGGLLVLVSCDTFDANDTLHASWEKSGAARL
jgi:hypothetical protein